MDAWLRKGFPLRASVAGLVLPEEMSHLEPATRHTGYQ